MIYDYLLVHSGDVESGPESLHPATPHRSGELLVKRELMRDGVTLLVGRELAKAHVDAAGVRYSASALTTLFLDYLEAPYARRLRDAASWLATRFGDVSDAALSAYISENLGRWGGEFTTESVIRDVVA